MRNLKRALSLGLTAAMISGLMVMGSSAVSYPDSDQIQNQTAVEILGEIGVMVGDDNGNFNPTQDVTRAEMAVIITRILYGNDLNVDQFKGMNLFTDVPAWAEGFVNLCASLDIVAGVGDGKFAPNETVTAAQAALMLSRALGYFQNNAEFGNDWALAAIRRATSAGIIGDDMVLAANEGLSRDNVAQMTFNTLTKAVPVQYNDLLNVYYNENQGITYALTFNYLQTLGYTNFDLVYDNGDTTIYGRPATTWGIGSYRTNTLDQDSGSRYDAELDANGGLISSKVQILSRDEIITIENEPTYVYTDATDEEDIYDDLGATICDEDEYDWSAYVNGEEVASADVVVPGRNVSTDYAYTGKGAQTEIYVDDADKTVTVVEINYYLGQIAHVDEEDGTVAIREVSDLSEDEGARLDDNDFATTAFEDDDYVVYTIDQNADGDFYICEMMAPETVDGTVTRVQNNASADNAYIYLDEDTKYNYSGKGHVAYDLNDEGKPRHPSTNTDYTLYLDPNGYVLAFSNEVTQRFLYVEDSHDDLGWSINATLDDGTSVTRTDIDSSLDNDNDVEGVLGHWDEVRYLTVGQANDKFNNADNGREYTWLDESELPARANRNFEISNIDYEIFEFETNSDGDEYTLSWRETKYANHVNILNGENYMVNVDDGLRRSDVTINDNTIFVNMEDGVVYTGRDEVPDVVNAEIAYVVEDDHTRDVAEIVYILDGNYRDADRIFFVITDEDRETVEYDGDLYFEFENTYVDGRPYEDLYISYDALIRDADIDSLRGYDDYLDNNSAVSTEIWNELAGKVIEVLDSDNGYATEIRVHYEWAAPIVADDSALDLSWTLWNPEADNRNPVGYNTGADTIYVEIYEEYNSNTNPTRVTGYDVDVCDVDDIIEWTDNAQLVDRDGRATLVNVVKDDDGEAQLVYVYNFDPDYHYRTVTINVNGVEYDRYDGEDSVFCRTWLISPDTAVKAFEAEMEDAGFNTDKNEYVYTVEGYEGDFAGDVQDFDKNGTWDNISIPTVHEDLVINITVENEDIAVLDGSDLILDVTDPTDAATPAWSIDIADGDIRYGFVVDLGDIDIDDVETVSWIERTSRNGQNFTNGERREATKADLYEVTVDGETAYAVYGSLPGTYNSSDKIVVRITDAAVNEIEPDTSITKVTLAKNGDITFEGGDTSEIYSAELWTLPETDKGGNWNRIWTGEYQYGNADKDINRDELVAGAYYYVVIDGVKSNEIHLVAPETTETPAD